MAEQRPTASLSKGSNIHCEHSTSSLSPCPEQYIYKRLEDAKTWIRLLILFPAGEDERDSPLRARIIPVRRDSSEAQNFFPVSYTWGCEDATSILWVEELDAGKPGAAILSYIPIRPNLEKLLTQFRRHSTPVALWVDALCIDQGHFEEKGSQVRHMDEVYRNREVHIWLGERSENSDVALDFIQGWIPYHEPFYKQGQRSAGSGYLKQEDTALKWRALWDLIGRPWFTRRWIVQEFVLSGHKHIWVGDRDFCWQHLISLAQAVVTTGIATVPLEECKTGICDRECPKSQGLGLEEYDGLPAMPGRIESLKSLDEAYLAFERGEEAYMTLEKLLDDFCGFFSSDERDGIYAFLSMASDMKDSDWEPDYSPGNSTAEVYAKATRHIIRQTGMLDIICRSNGKLSEHSWIPWFGPTELQGHRHVVHGYKKQSLTTFGQPLRAAADRLKLCQCVRPICNACNTEVLGIVHMCESCERFRLCDTCIKNASSSHTADHSFCRTLPVFGVYLASGGFRTIIAPETEFVEKKECCRFKLNAIGWFVDSVIDVRPGIEMTRTSAGEVLHTPDILADNGAPEPSGCSDDFARAITGNRTLRTVRRGEDDKVRQISCVPEWWVQAVRDAFALQARWRSSQGAPLPSIVGGREIQASLSVMASALASPHYAKTEKSIGFVPRKTKPEDAICILMGCTVPVVLRKARGTSWTLIGECYIEGLMEGEFMREVIDKSLEPTMVVLE